MPVLTTDSVRSYIIPIEYYASGVKIQDCGNNTFAYGGGNCAETAVFIDPETGDLHNPATKSNTAPPATWSMNSLSILAEMSATRKSSISMPATVTATVTPAMDPDYPHATAPSRLSTAACAGIAIGIAVAVTAIGILAWLLIRERKKRRVLQPGPRPRETLVPKKTSANKARPQELEDKERNEAPQVHIVRL